MTTDPPTLGTIGIREEHAELHRSVRRWVGERVLPAATKALLDEPDEALPAFWDDLVAQGWLGLHLPEEHGGEGYGLPELAVVLEELGRACTPGPFAPTVAASRVVALLGSDAQRKAWLPGLADGTTLGAVAHPARRPAVPGLRAEVGADGSVRLEGTVRPVLGAGLADLLVLEATAPDGPVWVLLPADQAEVTTLASVDATRRVAEVAVDATVGPDAVLGRPHDAEVGHTVAGVLAVVLGAESVGAIAWCTGVAAAYARDREQFGRPIGQFQAVKHRCAGMALALERSRAAVWDAVRGAESDREQALADAVVAAIVPADLLDAAKDCVQVLGGVGYTWEHDAHLYLKRALALHQLAGGPRPGRARVAALATSGARRSRDVELPPEAEPVRAEVRAFVAAVQARPRAEWNQALAEGGYLAPHWPAPWGRGADAVEQLVIDEELRAARIRRPHLQVAGWVLPTIIAHGTAEQQERWVGPTLRGELFWCQLFSEPGAGSDLASLATRAVRDDERGGWVVTGQKVWTTMAHLAGWGLLLARTGPPAPAGGWGPADQEVADGTTKHRGITAFVVDMATPGVEVRPLRELTGAEMFNEVFFTEAFVPDDCVIGQVGEGWEAARTTLANERVSMGAGSSFGPGVEVLVAQLAGLDGAPDTAADAVGALVAEAQAVAALGLRATIGALARAGGSATQPGAESSVRKLLGVELDQHVQEVGLELLAPAGAAADGDAGAWVNGFLGNRALSIAGGTSDVQRNIVAERLLGLPKDP